jgi:serine/threonine-protein kinase RsbW
MPLLERLRLPARLENLPRFLATIRDCASRQGFQQSRVFQMELATEEVLVNVINHAYQGADGPLEINCRRIEQGSLVIEIRDEGLPFDPLMCDPPDVMATLGDRPIGGLGVLIMKKLADGVTYKRQDNSNVLTLTFGPATLPASP